MSEYVIEMLNITKEFPGIKANDDITLQLRQGEIHALLGENGSIHNRRFLRSFLCASVPFSVVCGASGGNARRRNLGRNPRPVQSLLQR